MTEPPSPPRSVLNPSSVDELVDAIRQCNENSNRKCLAVGGRTKPALSADQDVDHISMRGIAGIMKYDPSEYTITVRAGTPIVEIQDALSHHDQWLPFDPPRSAMGATIGGAIACGWSGPMRWRFGGIRDFLLSVEMVDGTATVTRSGAAVVKNSAGFDIPKLMIGSAGRLGILTEVTLKVFPAPAQPETLAIGCADFAEASDTINTIARSPCDVSAIECVTSTSVAEMLACKERWMDAPIHVLVPIAGPAKVSTPIAARLRSMIPAARSVRQLDSDSQDRCWSTLRDWDVSSETMLVRIPVSPRQLIQVERFVSEWETRGRWYHIGLGGNVLFIGVRGFNSQIRLELSEQLIENQWRGMIIQGSDPSRGYLIGHGIGDGLVQRVRPAFDPHGRFAVPIDAA
ncbi:MAG: FAD-binding protein [Planctomycetota bacterium]